MEKVKVSYLMDNTYSSCDIENKSLHCPFCNTMIVPQYIFAEGFNDMNSHFNVFAKCTDNSCKQTFITIFERRALDKEKAFFNRISPTALPKKRDFNSITTNLSPNFVTIYNEANMAEQMNLSQICGTGYRKALEFLIKDYLISITPNQQESITKKFLSNCIKDDIENKYIKDVANRAVWIGNDETHYTRKWESKDVSDLKTLIDLTIYWIESEIRTKQVLQDMPNFK